MDGGIKESLDSPVSTRQVLLVLMWMEASRVGAFTLSYSLSVKAAEGGRKSCLSCVYNLRNKREVFERKDII